MFPVSLFLIFGLTFLLSVSLPDPFAIHIPLLVVQKAVHPSRLVLLLENFADLCPADTEILGAFALIQ